MENKTTTDGTPPPTEDIRSAELNIPLTEAERSLLDRVAVVETATWARLVLLSAAAKLN